MYFFQQLPRTTVFSISHSRIRKVEILFCISYRNEKLISLTELEILLRRRQHVDEHAAIEGRDVEQKWHQMNSTRIQQSALNESNCRGCPFAA